MFKFLPTIWIKSLGYVATSSVMYWVYDYVHVKPVRDVTAIYETKINTMVDASLVKDKTLEIAGKNLTECSRELQTYKDLARKNELESIYDTIDNITMEGEDENTTFNLDSFIF